MTSGMTWDVAWRALATLALILVIWAGVVALAIVTALLDAKQAKWQRATGPVLLMVAVREPDRRRRDLNWSKQVKRRDQRF